MQFALVTGASRGIGRAIATALARDAGHDVVVNYATNQSDADDVRREIESIGNGARAIIAQADIATRLDEPNATAEVVEAISRPE